MKRKNKRKPTSPGEILKEEFLMPLNITQKTLADHIGVDIKVINRIINGKCSVTADVAVRLAAALNTKADFWLNAQKAVDLYRAMEKNKKLPRPLYQAA
jgi:addiction module HigA family antidote